MTNDKDRTIEYNGVVMTISEYKEMMEQLQQQR